MPSGPCVGGVRGRSAQHPKGVRGQSDAHTGRSCADIAETRGRGSSPTAPLEPVGAEWGQTVNPAAGWAKLLPHQRPDWRFT